MLIIIDYYLLLLIILMHLFKRANRLFIWTVRILIRPLIWLLSRATISEQIECGAGQFKEIRCEISPHCIMVFSIGAFEYLRYEIRPRCWESAMLGRGWDESRYQV